MAGVEKRVDDLESRMDGVEDQLAEGDTRFAVLGAKLEHLTDKVSALTAVLSWVGGVIGLGVVTAAGSALVWVLAQMGK